jgi:hypothetical protein
MITTGKITNGTVYWQHGLTGELMVAPDTRMQPFPGYRRVQCETVAEVEQFSRRMAMQEYNKFRGMKVEEHMRSREKRERLKANCKLRLSKGCVSAEDERLTRQTLQSLEDKDRTFYRLIANEPDLTRASLVIERQEESTSAVSCLNKRRGLQDNEVNQIGKLVEAMA